MSQSIERVDHTIPKEEAASIARVVLPKLEAIPAPFRT